MGADRKKFRGASLIGTVKTLQAIVESHGEKFQITNPGSDHF